MIGWLDVIFFDRSHAPAWERIFNRSGGIRTRGVRGWVTTPERGNPYKGRIQGCDLPHESSRQGKLSYVDFHAFSYRRFRLL